jgi:UDP-N-acetylglucosamine transferase subunit ALG13
LVERLVEILPSDVEILWQTGFTDVDGLGISARSVISNQEMKQAMAEADVVITHAGTGSALLALGVGKYPVIVPRRKFFGEHVDDHQVQIVKTLGLRNLALCREVEDLEYRDLVFAAHQRIVLSDKVRPFSLGSLPGPASASEIDRLRSRRVKLTA